MRHIERPRVLAGWPAGIKPGQCLAPLFGRELVCAADVDASGLGARPAFTGPGPYQITFKLRQAAQDVSIKRPCGVVVAA